MKLIIVLFFFAFVSHCQFVYNYGSSSYMNASWMSKLDNGIPIRKLSIIGTHNSMGIGSSRTLIFQTQGSNLMTQMNSGMRALDIRCKH